MVERGNWKRKEEADGHMWGLMQWGKAPDNNHITCGLVWLRTTQLALTNYIPPCALLFGVDFENLLWMLLTLFGLNWQTTRPHPLYGTCTIHLSHVPLPTCCPNSLVDAATPWANAMVKLSGRNYLYPPSHINWFPWGVYIYRFEGQSQRENSGLVEENVGCFQPAIHPSKHPPMGVGVIDFFGYRNWSCFCHLSLVLLSTFNFC